METYRDLKVWQKAMALSVEAYRLTTKLPKTEQYGLVSQIRRSAVSIPANIAEGKMRGTDPQLARFLRIAFASGAELETHIELSVRLYPKADLDYTAATGLLSEVMKMLNVFITRLRANA